MHLRVFHTSSLDHPAQASLAARAVSTRVRRINLAALLELVHAVHHDHLSRRDALGDDRVVVALLRNLDRPQRDLVVRADDEDGGPLRRALDRGRPCLRRSAAFAASGGYRHLRCSSARSVPKCYWT